MVREQEKKLRESGFSFPSVIVFLAKHRKKPFFSVLRHEMGIIISTFHFLTILGENPSPIRVEDLQPYHLAIPHLGSWLWKDLSVCSRIWDPVYDGQQHL